MCVLRLFDLEKELEHTSQKNGFTPVADLLDSTQPVNDPHLFVLLNVQKLPGVLLSVL